MRLRIITGAWIGLNLCLAGCATQPSDVATVATAAPDSRGIVRLPGLQDEVLRSNSPGGPRPLRSE
jgi:hypothetical protein